ncbi:hypothetical protein I204_06832 [Kwoniella mangroviensis CBS 8886]|nr:hypothetical protein I204_06832 [Kwoniella mangroviensis CBS 8886]
MLAIYTSASFGVLSLLLLGDLANAKPHHSPLERRMNKHRRRGSLEGSISPSPPPVPLIPRGESDDIVVWIDITSTTTVTASSTQETSSSSDSDKGDGDPPAVVGAVLAGQDGGSNEEPNVVYVDITSTVIRTLQHGDSGGGAQATQPQNSQNSQNQPPPTTTITATRSKAIPTVGAVAISTGKGVTTTIMDTASGTAAAMSTASALPTNGANEEAQGPWVKYHNEARAKYQVGVLQWRADLVNLAKEKAELCNKKHTVAAENLQWGSGMGTPESAVTGWMGEDKLYNWNNPSYSDATGHFTQVVWKNTTSVGCWIAECPQGSVVGPQYDQSFQTACEYDPAGNFVGEQNFRENVLPAAY